MSKTINEYTPDYVSPPGSTLLDVLEERGMTQAELAERMERPKKTINEIIQGKTTITSSTALQFERVLDIPAHFWNNRERQYQEYQARLQEKQRLNEQVHWLNEFPINKMIDLGWIESFSDQTQQLQELLTFFGITSPHQWDLTWKKVNVAYRQSEAFHIDEKAVSAWLRQGERIGQQEYCSPYDAKKFRTVLNEIRALTPEDPNVCQPKLKLLCATVGVVVAFVPQLPKTRVSGATRWLTPTKALIQLSLRYKSDDHFWFSFFHEAGHILLHGKRDLILEMGKTKLNREKEDEANQFAANFLIPPSKLKAFLEQTSRLSKQRIKDFADKLGIAPGIVVGRLQHDGYLPHNHCNDLKRRFDWT